MQPSAQLSAQMGLNGLRTLLTRLVFGSQIFDSSLCGLSSRLAWAHSHRGFRVETTARRGCKHFQFSACDIMFAYIPGG